MSFATQHDPGTIRIEVREMILGIALVGMLAGVVALFWGPRAEGEEFVLTLPPGAP